MIRLLQKFAWLYPFALSILLPAANAEAQPAGHPIATHSHREFTVSFDGGVVRLPIAGVANYSRRFMLRTAYGLAGRFDLFGLVGAVKLKLSPENKAQTMDDRYRLAYGAGFIWHFLDFVDDGIRVIIGAQIVRFKVQPTMREALLVSDSEVEKVFQLKYDWRELGFNTGFNKKFSRFNFYVGANARVIHRQEVRAEKLMLNGDGVSVNETRGVYRSGLLFSPLIGCEISFPARLKLNFEGIATGKTSYTFYVGLSQTGVL